MGTILKFYKFFYKEPTQFHTVKLHRKYGPRLRPENDSNYALYNYYTISEYVVEINLDVFFLTKPK